MKKLALTSLTILLLSYLLSLTGIDTPLIGVIPVFFTSFFTWISWTINTPQYIIIAAIFIALLLYLHKREHVIRFLIAIAANQASTELLKAIIARPRPTLPLIETIGYSFPSGHASASLILLTSIALSTREHKHHKTITALCGTYALLVGASRVILRAHYPTDVLAGWSLALIWIAITWRQSWPKARHHLARHP